MSDQRTCNMCQEALDYLCTNHGGQFCDLREVYYRDHLPPDETLYKVQAIVTPEQQAQLQEHLRSVFSG